MKTRYIIYLIIPLICGLLNYFVTLNLIYSLIIIFIGLIVLYFFNDKQISSFIKKDTKTRDCLMFINNFIITLSINQSINETYSILKESFSKGLLNQSKMIAHLNEEEQIHYLAKYFDLNVYEVFLNLLDQYIYNGGDILKIAQILLFDIRSTEDMLENHLSTLVKKIVEFASLWGMSFLIVLIIKFSLTNFLSDILSSNLFLIGLLIFFLIFYINLTIFILHGFSLNFIKTSKTIEKKRKTKNEKAKRKNKFSK